MSKIVHFVFDVVVGWEPEDFDCADPHLVDAYNDNEALVKLSTDNLRDVMHDWISDGGHLEFIATYIEEDEPPYKKETYEEREKYIQARVAHTLLSKLVKETDDAVQ